MWNQTRLIFIFLLLFLFFSSVTGNLRYVCGTEGNFKIIEESHKAIGGVELVFIESAYDKCGNTQIYLTNLGSNTATEVTGTGMTRKPVAWPFDTSKPTNALEPGATTFPLFFVEDFHAKKVNPIKVSAVSAEGATAEATITYGTIKIESRIENLLIRLLPIFLLVLPVLAILIYIFFKGYKILSREYALVIVAGLWILLFLLYAILLFLS